MKNIAIFTGIYTHRHGRDVFTDTSHDVAIQRKATIAREWWVERNDHEAPEDHSTLSDAEVINAYFDGNETEFYEIIQTFVEIPK